MNEMQIVAQSLGVLEDKALGEMLQTQCNPGALLRRNREYLLKGRDVVCFRRSDIKEQNAMRVSLDELVESLRRW